MDKTDDDLLTEIKHTVTRPNPDEGDLWAGNSPTEDTQDEVHDEERAQHHHWHKIDKLPAVAHGIMHLEPRLIPEKL